MDFHLIDSGWDQVLASALMTDHSSLSIACPFIKACVVRRLVRRAGSGPIRVVTRFNLLDFAEGVSDIAALRLLINAGATIRGVKNLHAKLYVFGDRRVIVTSANLTNAALLRNHEFGFVADAPDIVLRCQEYFDALWARAVPDLESRRLDDWERRVTEHLLRGARSVIASGLTDEGVDAGISATVAAAVPATIDGAEQAFVKFFGQRDNRADRTMKILDEVRSSGSHWACTYPYGKRPRRVRDGAIMFMGRLVDEPDDILIYGRAVAIHHVPDRDDATEEEKRAREWKTRWPHYVRVHHAEFIGGSLSNGVSLNLLMDELRANAFASTRRNAVLGSGNTDPRRAYMRQAAVELSAEGAAWLNERLERAFAEHGKLPPVVMEQLDWPAIAVQPEAGH